MPTVEATVIEYLRDSLGNDVEITLDSTLNEDLGLDSLDVIELSLHLENTFNIIIDDLDIGEYLDFKTVKDLIDAIRIRYDLDN